MQYYDETSLKQSSREISAENFNGRAFTIDLSPENFNECDITYTYQDETVAKIICTDGKVAITGFTKYKINLTGQLTSDFIEVACNGQLEIFAKLHAKNELLMQAENVTIAKNSHVNSALLAIKSPGFILNNGMISGNEVILNAHKMSNFNHVSANKMQVHVEKNLYNCGLISSGIHTHLKGSTLVNRGRIDSEHTLHTEFSEIRLEEGEVEVKGHYEVSAKKYIDNSLTISSGYSLIKADEIFFAGEQKFNIADIQALKKLELSRDNSMYVAKCLNLNSDEVALIDGKIEHDASFDLLSSKIAKHKDLSTVAAGFNLNARTINYLANADLGDLPVTINAQHNVIIGNESLFSCSASLKTNLAILIKANFISNQGRIDAQQFIARANRALINRGEIVANYSTIDATTLVNVWHISSADLFVVNCIVNINSGLIRSSAHIINGIVTFNAGLQLFELPSDFCSLFNKTKLMLSAKVLATNIMPQISSILNLLFSLTHLYQFYPHLSEHMQGLYSKIRTHGVSSIEIAELLPVMTMIKDVGMSSYGLIPVLRQMASDLPSLKQPTFTSAGFAEKPGLLAFESLQVLLPKSYCDNIMSINTGAIATLNYTQRSLEDIDSGFKTALQMNLEARKFQQSGLWLVPNLHVNGDHLKSNGIIICGLDSSVNVKTLHQHQSSQFDFTQTKVVCDVISLKGSVKAIKSELLATKDLTVSKGASVSVIESSLSAKHLTTHGKILGQDASLLSETIELGGSLEGDNVVMATDTVHVSTKINLSDTLSVKANKEMHFNKNSDVKVANLFVDATETHFAGDVRVTGSASLKGENYYNSGNFYTDGSVSMQYNKVIANLYGATINGRHVEMSSLVYFALLSALIGRSSLRQYSVLDLSFLSVRRSFIDTSKSVASFPLSLNLPHMPDNLEDILSWSSFLSTTRMLVTMLPIPHIKLISATIDISQSLYYLYNRISTLHRDKGLNNAEMYEIVPIIVESLDTAYSVAKVSVEYANWKNAKSPVPLTAFQRMANKFVNFRNFLAQSIFDKAYHLGNAILPLKTLQRSEDFLTSFNHYRQLLDQYPRFKNCLHNVMIIAGPKLNTFSVFQFGAGISISGIINERTIFGETWQYGAGLFGVTLEGHRYIKHGSLFTLGAPYVNVKHLTEEGDIYVLGDIVSISDSIRKSKKSTWKSIRGAVSVTSKTGILEGKFDAKSVQLTVDRLILAGGVKCVQLNIIADKYFYNDAEIDSKHTAIDTDLFINNREIIASSSFQATSKIFRQNEYAVIYSPKTHITTILYNNGGLIMAYHFNLNALIEANQGMVIPCLPEHWSDVINFSNAYNMVKVGAAHFYPAVGLAMNLAQKLFNLPDVLASVANHAAYMSNVDSKDFRVRHMLPGIFEIKNAVEFMVEFGSDIRKAYAPPMYDSPSISTMVKSAAKDMLSVVGPSYVSESILSCNSGGALSYSIVQNSVFAGNYGAQVAVKAVYRTLIGHNGGAILAVDLTIRGHNYRSDGLLANSGSLFLDLNSFTTGSDSIFYSNGIINLRIRNHMSLGGEVVLLPDDSAMNESATTDELNEQETDEVILSKEVPTESVMANDNAQESSSINEESTVMTYSEEKPVDISSASATGAISNEEHSNLSSGLDDRPITANDADPEFIKNFQHAINEHVAKSKVEIEMKVVEAVTTRENELKTQRAELEKTQAYTRMELEKDNQTSATAASPPAVASSKTKKSGWRIGGLAGALGKKASDNWKSGVKAVLNVRDNLNEKLRRFDENTRSGLAKFDENARRELAEVEVKVRRGGEKFGGHIKAGTKNLVKFIEQGCEVTPKIIEEAFNKAGGDISNEWKRLPPDAQKAIIVAAAVAVGYGACYLAINSGATVAFGVGTNVGGQTVIMNVLTYTPGAGVQLFPAVSAILAGTSASDQLISSANTQINVTNNGSNNNQALPAGNHHEPARQHNSDGLVDNNMANSQTRTPGGDGKNQDMLMPETPVKSNSNHWSDAPNQSSEPTKPSAKNTKRMLKALEAGSKDAKQTALNRAEYAEKNQVKNQRQSAQLAKQDAHNKGEKFTNKADAIARKGSKAQTKEYVESQKHNAIVAGKSAKIAKGARMTLGMLDNPIDTTATSLATDGVKWAGRKMQRAPNPIISNTGKSLRVIGGKPASLIMSMVTEAETTGSGADFREQDKIVKMRMQQRGIDFNTAFDEIKDEEQIRERIHGEEDDRRQQNSLRGRPQFLEELKERQKMKEQQATFSAPSPAERKR